MIVASTDVLSHKILQKCNELCIDVYALKNSKRNTLAFTSHNRKRREFEIAAIYTQLVYKAAFHIVNYTSFS